MVEQKWIYAIMPFPALGLANPGHMAVFTVEPGSYGTHGFGYCSCNPPDTVEWFTDEASIGWLLPGH